MGFVRKGSNSQVYHVVLKGNGGQLIFETDADRLAMCENLKTATDRYGVSHLAFCLMDNHVHLIISDPHDNLSAAMRFVSQTYAQRYNFMHARTGSVFEHPFWSEPIENDAYALSAVLYVHNNPQAAGMCPAKDYRWSSYAAYAYDQDETGLSDTSMLLDLFGGPKGFIEMSEQYRPTAVPFHGSRFAHHLTDSEAVRIAADLLGEGVAATLNTLRPAARAPFIARLNEAGFSQAQICRLTGLSRSQVGRHIVQQAT